MATLVIVLTILTLANVGATIALFLAFRRLHRLLFPEQPPTPIIMEDATK